MNQNVRFKKTTTKRSKVSPSVAVATQAQAFKVKLLIITSIPNSSHSHFIFSGYIGCNGNFIGNFYPLAKFHQYSSHIFTYEILVVVTANWQIG